MADMPAETVGVRKSTAALEIHELVRQAQQGDERARERLLSSYKPFILRAAASVSGKFVRVGQDDEASIALMAFNEAISAYNHRGGSSFFSFAEMVIRRRLIDHFRQANSRRMEIPMSGLVTGESADGELEDPLLQVEVRESQRQFDEAVLAQERREEILRLAQLLEQFGIRFRDLVATSPRHRDARQRALEVARIIASNPAFSEQLMRRGSLPLKELEPIAGVSRKTLERQRKYIIAMAVILCGDFGHLKEYLGAS